MSVSDVDGPVGEQLVKSRERVADHGEVFTPAWLVEDMLDLVEDESERIDARFLEPACGAGNFLVPVLQRKLATAYTRYAKSTFERRHHGLFGLMCVYGIELLADNTTECRASLVATFDAFIAADRQGEVDVWHDAAVAVTDVNVVNRDALVMADSNGEAIVFAEWAYLGKGSSSGVTSGSMRWPRCRRSVKTRCSATPKGLPRGEGTPLLVAQVTCRFGCYVYGV